MLLKIESVEFSSESESDFDTAIDMVHYSHTSLEYKLVSPAGLHVTLSCQAMSSSYSYLEPDFEHWEQTGESVYEHHSSDETGSEEISYRAELCLPPRLFVLTEQDFLNRKLRAAGQLHDSDAALLSFEAQERLSHDLDYAYEPLFLGVGADDFDRLQAYGKNDRFCAADTLPGLLHVLLEQEAIAQKIRIDNLSARIQNKATELLVDLACWRQCRISQLHQDLSQALRPTT